LQTEPLLKVKKLKKYYPIKSGVFSRVTGHVKAVDDIDLEIQQGETFSLVGESGCGKSTAGTTLLRLQEPTAGESFYNGTDIFSLDKKKMRNLRKDIQMIFQDPYSSLNPRMTIGETIGEALLIHKLAANNKEKKQKVQSTMEICGLSPHYYNRYPHEFSGGQRQRVVIARALALEPKFIVADEPISALDVSIQAQIVNLLDNLQAEFGLTYLFISHDLSVVKHVSDWVAVMYLGKIVEKAPQKLLYNNPQHPYSQALLSAVPTPDPSYQKKRIILTGDVPSPSNPPSGCHFHPRCPYAFERCLSEIPVLTGVDTDHHVACHLVNP